MAAGSSRSLLVVGSSDFATDETDFAPEPEVFWVDPLTPWLIWLRLELSWSAFWVRLRVADEFAGELLAGEFPPKKGMRQRAHTFPSESDEARWSAVAAISTPCRSRGSLSSSVGAADRPHVNAGELKGADFFILAEDVGQVGSGFADFKDWSSLYLSRVSLESAN